MEGKPPPLVPLPAFVRGEQKRSVDGCVDDSAEESAFESLFAAVTWREVGARQNVAA
jgi:hypothetical protein